MIEQRWQPVVQEEVSVTHDSSADPATPVDPARLDASVTPLPDRADRRQSDADGELLRVLHDQHAAALWGFVMHLTGGDRSRAEDVVQETLFRAWRRPAVLAQKEASARGWLFTVARNIVVDDWRAAQRRPTTSAELLPELLEPDGTDTAVQSIMVAEALRRLSRDHRAVLLECYFRGCTAAQAAVRLGVPVGTVKSRLHYALHALRLILEEMGVVT
jgi:RNA polymerase sigma-70 factor (ECF subfamily)